MNKEFRRSFLLPAALLTGVLFSDHKASAQILVDGILGAEWAGVTPVSIPYDATYNNSGNFGAPEPKNGHVAFDSYIRADQSWVYGLFQAKPAGAGLDGWESRPGDIANLYTTVLQNDGTTGSSLGFEVTSSRAFKPGGAGPFALDSSEFVTATVSGTTYANGGLGSTIEFAVSVDYLRTNPDNIPNFVPLPSEGGAVRFNMGQFYSFTISGYNTASGSTERLGLAFVPVPEPSHVALGAASALLGWAVWRKKRKL